ncbi:DUF4238 domain-containing protein [Aequorivita capsosiphonis]|uniref:DUF4238 domain-containing protein n=1 Tax=Aequorivita capsosiphonis TaxID=487317 RepID=UPI0003FB0C42|nr:DUF4238 domain-containing protein [Aequorivita capsosiphonis]
MKTTIRTHYNPCFWTSYWNFDYLNRKRLNPELKENVRKKEVFVLNLKSDKIFIDVTQNVFYKKKLGLATITKEGALDFTKRNFPNELENIQNRYKKDKSELTLDFENYFTLMEESYRIHLEELILNDKAITINEKAYLTFFVLFQALRNPNSLDDMTELYKANGLEKFELLVSIRHKISDYNGLAELSAPFSVPTWNIYKLKKNIFPLSDNPVLAKNGHIMVAISPNIMLELDLKEKCKEVNPVHIKTRISYLKKKEFIKRTILNSSREIIFGEERVLQKIKKSRIYKKHLERIKNAC